MRRLAGWFMKYMLFLVVAAVLAAPVSVLPALEVIRAWVLIMCVYECGYFCNDRIASTESVASRPRGFTGEERLGPFLAVRITAIVVLLAIPALIPTWWSVAAVLAVAAVFSIHNVLPSQNRVLTYIALKSLSTLYPVMPILFLRTADAYSIWRTAFALIVVSEVLPRTARYALRKNSELANSAIVNWLASSIADVCLSLILAGLCVPGGEFVCLALCLYQFFIRVGISRMMSIRTSVAS